MVHCKNWDRAHHRAYAVRDRKRHRPARCKSHAVKAFERMEART